MTLLRYTYIYAALLAVVGCGNKQESAQAPTQTTAESAAPAQTGGSTITGSIKFMGNKPANKKISMSADAFCKTQHTTDVFAEEVVVNPNGTLKNVYVYIKSGFPADQKFPISSTPAVLDQMGCVYHPHVLAVQAGQEIVIRNSDGVLHNINARPKNNQGFNIGQPVKNMETKKKFANAELGIPLKCDVHPWMGGYINVQNHPFASVSNDNGSFTLTGVPAGTYVIEAWHEKYGTTTQSVTVGATETKTVQFSFKG